jgi:hypothetical protein
VVPVLCEKSKWNKRVGLDYFKHFKELVVFIKEPVGNW